MSDEPIEIRRSARRKRTVTAFREAGRIVVAMPQGLSDAAEQRHVTELVAKLKSKEQLRRAPSAPGELTQRAHQLASQYLRSELSEVAWPTSVNWVNNQHRRWASCTPMSGRIRLSSRLQSMPDWVVDYVLVHELAHLVESNHTARFWALVGRYPLAERARGYLEGVAAALDFDFPPPPQD